MKPIFRALIVTAALVVCAGFPKSAFAQFLYQGPDFKDPFGNASTTAYIGKCSNCCWDVLLNGKPAYSTCQVIYIVSGSSCKSYYLGGSNIEEDQTYNGLGGGDTVTVVKSGQVTMPSACAHKFGTPILYPLNYGGYYFDIHGGDGNDTIAGGAGNTWIVGDAGGDIIFTSDYASAHSYGTGGNDLIYGSNAINNESLYGEADNDVLCGGTGAYLLDGGDGNDSCTATNVTYRRNCERNDAQAYCGGN